MNVCKILYTYGYSAGCGCRMATCMSSLPVQITETLSLVLFLVSKYISIRLA